MRKIVLFISFLVSLISFAGEVTEQEALQKAQQFMKGKHFTQKNLRRAAAIGGKSFYVFNADQDGGFVIVSADDRTEAILGYADQGALDANQLPENAKKWLEGYELQIRALGNSPHKYNSQRRVISDPVAPLITAHWGQGAPYNNMCPLDGENKSVTGCVATAMAQVMYYHKWPTAKVGPFPAYTTGTKGIEVEEISETTFKWDNMHAEYNYDETGESADAVAELMRYCGQAVEMNYTAGESGAIVLASHMINYFGYSKTAQDVWREEYTTKDWEELMYQELKGKRPILYCGYSGEVGHEFIIDGYDDKGLFHVNWGWYGSFDGYFVLSVLNPDDRGIGGGTSSNGYTIGQRALIGVQPDHGEEGAQPRIFCDPDFTTATYIRTGTEDFDVDVEGLIWAFVGKDVTVDYRWVLCQEGTIVKEFDPVTVIIKDGWASNVSATLSFGASLANGDYELRVMYRVNSSDTWRSCYYSSGYYDLFVTINGETLTLKKVSDITDIYQVNSVNLEGAKKTQRGMTATLNWTYKGYDNEHTFYLWDEGEEPIATVSSYLNHNQTEDLNIHFAPKKAGSITYKISTDYDKTNVIWTSEQTIEASLPHNLDGEIAIEGEKNNTIEGTTINATITLKNEGENAYNDQILIELIPIDEQSYYVYDETKTIYKDVSLAAGAEKPLTVQFADLTKGQCYEIDVCYYSYNETNDYVARPYAAWTTCTVGTIENIPGDVNGDGLVNVTDIVATVNYIMEKPSPDFNKEAADLNGDGEINVTDIVKMVTIIMNGDGGSSRRAAAISSNMIISGNNILLRNAEGYTAAQFDINLSDGQSISNVVLNGSSNHDLYWKMIDANTCRVVVYSMTNAAFHVNGDNLFTIFMNGGQSATISNELLIKAEGTTGIDTIRREAENGKVYDLNGRQVKTPRKGVYIINGRKVVVK